MSAAAGVFPSAAATPNAIDLSHLSQVDPKTKAKTSKEWLVATEFLSESDKAKSGVKSSATPVMYNPITGLLETTVKLRGTVGSLYGSNKTDLKLTGITANQLAESYYTSNEIQYNLNRMDNSRKAVSAALNAARQRKDALAKELQEIDVEIAKIGTLNPATGKITPLNPAGARLVPALESQRAQIINQQKAAQAAANKAYTNSTAAHAAMVMKPRVLAPPGAAAATSKPGFFGSLFGAMKTPRRRVNRRRSRRN